MKNFKKNRGITLIALVITIIVMLILATITVNIATNAIDRAKLESLKTDMISIKAKAKTIEEKYNFKDIEKLVGTKLDTDENTEGIQNDNISIELKTILEAKKEEDNTQYKLDLSNLYVWSEEDLTNQGLSITTTDTSFYIVYYDLNACEVYYSLGYNGAYSLTDINNK